jgi:cysteine sulfinate desulfinase/cysteine desulfurase-like protein
MQIDKSVANNAIRLSVGRETTYSQIDLAIHDLRQSINTIVNENQ